jgi:WD40 repeat protein
MADFSERGYARIGQDHLRSLASTSNGAHWLIGSSDHHIYAFNRQTGQVDQQWLAHDNSVFALQLHQAGHYLLSGGRDAYLNVWDQQQQFKLIKRIPAHNFTINDIAMHPSGDFFVTASRDKTIKVWDAYQFELLKVIDHARYDGHIHSVNRLLWLSQDNSLLSCSDDRRLLRWRITVAK